MDHYKRHLSTFLILHFVLIIIFFLSHVLFTNTSVEIYAYLIWFIIIFSFFSITIQSVLFSILTPNLKLNKFLLFAVILFVELAIANAIAIYSYGGDGLTLSMVSGIKNHQEWRNIASSLIIHEAIVFATLLTVIIRPFYAKVHS